MKQVEATCQQCKQVILVQVDDHYDPSDPLGLLRLVVCESCFEKRIAERRKEDQARRQANRPPEPF